MQTCACHHVYVSIVIPQVGATLTEAHVDCAEWQQSSAVESPRELVAPGNVFKSNLVDIQSFPVQLSVYPDDIYALR